MALFAATLLGAAVSLGSAEVSAPRAAPPVATAGAAAEAALQAGQLRLDDDDEAGGERVWRQALQRQEDSGLLYALGGLYFRQARLALAESCFERLARRSPDLADAWYQLGLVRAARGRYKDAADAQRLAVAQSPNFGQAYCALALDLRESGQTAEGLVAAREALRLLPNYAGAWNLLGNLQQDLGAKEEAAKSYHAALVLEPRYAGAWFNLAMLLQRENRFAEATTAFGHALDVRPTFAEARLARAELALDEGSLGPARKDFDEVTRIAGWEPEGWWGLHRVAKESQRNAKAADAMLRYRDAVHRRDKVLARAAKAGREQASAYEPGLPLAASGSAVGAPVSKTAKGN